MYRSAFVNRVLGIFMDFYGNLEIYKKLVKKIFFNKMLGVALSSSPKRNQITLYRQPIYRKTSVSSRLRFPQTDCCKCNKCCKCHNFITFLPNLSHNFYYFQSHSILSDHSHRIYNIQPYHLSFYHSSLPTHQSRYFRHQTPLYES